jgi:ferritin-like metal-binding protein YciE
MPRFNNLNDLYVHELKDLYSAETQLVKALPKLEEAASHEELKKAFHHHLQETKNQVERLEKIGKNHNIDLKGETCEAMKGLIREGSEMLEASGDSDTKDAGLIASAQRVEHYEIAGYGTAVHFAERLGLTDDVKILQETLKEEKEADTKLNKVAVQKVNEEATH